MTGLIILNKRPAIKVIYGRFQARCLSGVPGSGFAILILSLTEILKPLITLIERDDFFKITSGILHVAEPVIGQTPEQKRFTVTRPLFDNFIKILKRCRILMFSSQRLPDIQQDPVPISI